MNDEKLQTFKSLTFGTELEYENITRRKMAEAIQSVVGGRIDYQGGPHDTIAVIDAEGRAWKAMSDGSLRGGAEFVTPILKWENIELLQAIIRAIRHAGAKTPATTSQHVHVGVEGWTAEQLTNLVRIHYKQEKLIHKSAGTLETRLQHYTRPTDRDFVERILSRKPHTLDELNEAWFGRRTTSFGHYDGHRYRSLNLNPVWESKHTVEWRFYENKDVMGTRTETSTDCFPKVPIIFIGSPAGREYGKTSDFAFRAQKSYRFSRNLSLSREG